ncbi:hypothetical protein FRC03_000999 [Tulasnella sp. 419]|nr:hypothetical protein FRC03_000999 [Tulasnella sp. 419]
MLRKLFKIQRDEFPVLKSITAPVYDTALNWVDPYIEYFAQYPMAVLAIDQELAQNPRFKTFYENTHYKRQDLKSLIYRPVDRLAKISFPLVEIQRRSPPTNKDGLETIPQILDIIGYLRRATNVVVDDGTMKAKLWGYKQSLVYPFAGEIETCLDLDLCLGLNDPLRTMVHSGKLLRESETAGEWSEVFVLLLDNYLIVTAPKEKEGVTKYYIEKRIALELLTLGSFTNAPVPRFQPTSRGNMNIFGRGRSIDHKDYLYPLHLVAYASITGRPTASCLNLILYADGEESRTKWRTELEGAIGLRKHVQEAKMAFHLTALSDLETFRIAPPLALGPGGSNGWISGRVHCSATLTIFNEQGGRLQLIAAGCDEGIGMALQGDMTTWRRLMPLKGVTQCATLDDFGIFLVLAEGDLYAYPIENLVPAARNFIMASGGARPRTFQRMNTKSDVHHFTIGTYQGRTLVAYVMKHGTDSIVCVQEPVVGKISDSSRNNSWWSSARATGQGKYWFRDYIQPFKVASTAFDCTFFKGKIVIPFNKGFHVLNLSNLDLSVVLPRRDESRFGSILARRCEASRPLGIFPASGSDLLACYEDFGFWIDRKGDISRRNSNGVPYIIEWECKARKVAYHEPYLLIFTPRFIEYL